MNYAPLHLSLSNLLICFFLLLSGCHKIVGRVKSVERVGIQKEPVHTPESIQADILKAIEDGKPHEANLLIERARKRGLVSMEKEATFKFLVGELYAKIENYTGAFLSFTDSAMLFPDPLSSLLSLKMAYNFVQELPPEDVYNVLEDIRGRISIPEHFWGYLATSFASSGDAEKLRTCIKRYIEACGDMCSEEILNLASKYRGNSVGLILPLSGKLSSIGNEILLSILLARPPGIKVYTEDSQNKLGESTLKLISSGAVTIMALIIGDKIPDELYGIQDGKIFLINSQMQLDHSFFRAIPPAKSYVDTLLDFISSEFPLCKFLVISPDDRYGRMSAKYFKDGAKRRNIDIVKSVSYKPGKTNFSKELKPIKNLDFGCVFNPDTSSTSGLLIPQFSFWGMIDKKFFGLNLWNSQKFIEIGEERVEGAIFVDSVSPQSFDFFSKKFSRVYGFKPMVMSQLVYDTFGIISKLKSEEDLSKCYKASSGYISFSNGEMLHSFYILTVKDGKIEAIKDTFRNCGKAVN